jgi:hypothetical protein
MGATWKSRGRLYGGKQEGSLHGDVPSDAVATAQIEHEDAGYLPVSRHFLEYTVRHRPNKRGQQS